MKINSKILLATTALFATSLMSAPKAFAQCATTGTITASCNLNAGTTGDILIGNSGADVTVTIDNTLTIGNTINQASGAQGTFIITDGGGRTVTQNAAIGSSAPIDRITIANTDTWNAGADVSTTEGVYYSATGGALTISGGTFSSNIVGQAGGDTLNLTGGTLTGNTNLGEGSDGVTLGAETVTGTLSGGGGASDSLSLAADYTTGNTISGFEAIDLNGNRLTVVHTIGDVAATSQAGLNVDGGNLDINAGGLISGTIYDDNAGQGRITLGADTNGGTFNLGGRIEDVDLTLASGTLNTNGNALGAVIGQELTSITVAAGSRFNVNDNVISSGALSNAGTIFIDAENRLTAASQGAGGTYILELERDTEDDINRVGSFAITGGGGINLTNPTTIEIVIPATSGVLPERTELLIGDGAAAITNDPVALTAVSNNTFLYDTFIVNGDSDEIDDATSDDPQDLYLVTTRKSLSANSSTTSNAKIANMLLNELAENTDTGIQALQGSIQTAPTKEAFNARLEAMLPSVDGAVREAALTAANQTISLTSNRLSGLRQNKPVSGMASGGVTEGVQLWFQPFIQSATQNQRDQTSGYESKTYGAAIGFDNDSIFDSTVLGVALAMANTDIDADNINSTETEVDSFMMSAYGDHNFDDGSFINAQIGYSYNDIKSTRYNVGGLSNINAIVDYTSDQFSAYTEYGKDMEWGDYTTLTPTVSLAYSYQNSDDYVEQGEVGGGGLSVDTSDSSILDIGIGLEASWLYRPRNGGYIQPKLHGKLSYDVIGDAVETATKFKGGGSQLAIVGADPAQFSVNTGLGLTYVTRSNFEISAEYDLHYKEDYDAHTGRFKIGYKF